MSMDITFEMKNEYLHVQVTGTFSLDEANRGFVKALEFLDTHPATKILIDTLPIEGSANILDYYSYGLFISNELAKTGLKRKIRLAYVAKTTMADAQAVANNRGVNLKAFGSVKEALAWLGIKPETDDRG